MYDLWSEKRWWERAALLQVLAPRDHKTLAHAWGPCAAPEFAFLAIAEAGMLRSVVAVEPERTVMIHVHREKHTHPNRIDGVDLEGGTAGRWAVLFHTEPTLARSAVSFDTSGRGAEVTRYLVTGLAPGDWQVWRNGWLEDLDGFVRPGECVLYFERAPGSFFLRRLS